MPFIYDAHSPPSSTSPPSISPFPTSRSPPSASIKGHPKMCFKTLFGRASKRGSNSIDLAPGFPQPPPPSPSRYKWQEEIVIPPPKPGDPPMNYDKNGNVVGMYPMDANNAPPSYTAPGPSAAPATDNPYAFLATFDTVFLIDDSGSMAGGRWRQCAAALAAIAPICTQHDRDGIDMYFLNAKDKLHYRNVTSAQAVNDIFSAVSPGGGTPTGQRLNQILNPYLRELQRKGVGRVDDIKPLNIIVLTDGQAHDDPESVIVRCAKILDKLEAPAWQIGIQFFQVGEDLEATQALKELDDGLILMGCERDIVDTVPYIQYGGTHDVLKAEVVLKVVLGAVNRRLDRKNVSLDNIRR